MKRKKLVEKLAQSIREAGAILRGEMKPPFERVVEPASIKEIRSKLGVSQSEFARMIGIPVKTVQNWEQGRTQPDAPAKALMRIAEKHPEAVLDALYGRAS
jgi:putative transcriptional regulator